MIEEPDNNRKKRRKKGKTKKQWEELREAPIIGISSLPSGGLVSAPISGKALPRLGRAIRSSMTSGIITGDQNPLTRIDGNNNGLIFDGTWREMPDPTPGNRTGVSGMMGRRDNPTKFVGLKTLLDKHFAQSEMFDQWEKNRDWNAFHRNHFDWWMFPIPRGSNSYGDGYNVSGQPLEELKSNDSYMKSLAKAVRQYLRAMAWDVDKNDWIDDAEVDRGQNPIGNINSARLYKIAQSTYAHGMMKEHMSIRRMANNLIQNNVRVGNEDYWTGPVGVSGRMSTGNNINPTRFEPVGSIVDPFSKEWEKLWNSRDDMSPKNSKKLWDWKDEAARIEYATKLSKGKVQKGFLSWGEGDSFGKKMGDIVSSVFPILERELGLVHVKVGTYPGFFEPFGLVVSHSISPHGSKADANIVRDLLGKYSEEINPYEFYARFESWIRNPYVTIKDPTTGKNVGVRKYFNDNRALMLGEFRRRVASLFDAAYMKEHNMPYSEWKGSETDSIEVTPKELLEALKTIRPDTVEKAKIAAARILKTNASARSMHRFHSVFIDELSLRASPEETKLITPGVLRELLNEIDPTFDSRKKIDNPDFYNPDIYGDLSDSQLQFARDFADSMIQELVEIKEKEMTIPESNVAAFTEILQSDIPKITEQHSRVILANSLLKMKEQRDNQYRGISGKMTTPSPLEADYIGYNPENPRSIANHMHSKESSYDVRPEPVDDIKTAIETGAPLRWLMPGSYHPEIEEILNEITEYVIDNDFDSIEDIRETGTGDREKIDDYKLRTGEWIGKLFTVLAKLGFFHKNRDLNEEEIFMVEALSGAKITKYDDIEDAINNSTDPRAGLLRNLINREEHIGQTNMVASALVARASHAGFKTVFLSSLSGEGTSATEETIDFWNRSIDAALHNNSPSDYRDEELKPEIAISMPVNALLDMLTGNGEYKTLFDEGVLSRGNNNENARLMQEFAMFGYLPGYKGKRPIYGVVAPGGITTESLEYTHNYGPIKIVMKPEVRDRSTWTESDSLSITSTASSFSNPSKHGLVSENLKGELEQFMKEDRYVEPGEPIETTYTEAQIHGGVTVDDIAYIVIDDRFYNSSWFGKMNWPKVDIDGNAITTLPETLDEYGPYIQISKIAESLQIPIVLAEEVINAGEDEAIRP
jgi:hypothetical protein